MKEIQAKGWREAEDSIDDDNETYAVFVCGRLSHVIGSLSDDDRGRLLPARDDTQQTASVPAHSELERSS